MSEMHDRFVLLTQKIDSIAPEDSFFTPATDSEIEQAETELGVVLPYSYKLFLKKYGAADWPNYIYGLGEGVVPILDVVKLTETERSMVDPELPHHLVPFCPDGFGNHFCIDTSQVTAQESPIVIWNHEGGENQELKQTHPSYIDWFEEFVDTEME